MFALNLFDLNWTSSSEGLYQFYSPECLLTEGFNYTPHLSWILLMSNLSISLSVSDLRSVYWSSSWNLLSRKLKRGKCCLHKLTTSTADSETSLFGSERKTCTQVEMAEQATQACLLMANTVSLSRIRERPRTREMRKQNFIVLMTLIRWKWDALDSAYMVV